MTYDHPVPLDTSAVPCRKDPELFFSQPDDSGKRQLTEARIAQAKKMCADCPLKDPCLSYAIRFAVEGTWGGSTLKERNKFRDDNGLVAIPVVSSPYTMRAYQLRVDGAASVIMLDPSASENTPPRKPISRRLRYEILRRDGHACYYCHAADTPLTIDHVVPVSLGGTDNPSNLVAACRDCNGGKASSTPDAATVAQVDADALRWAQAIRRAMEIADQDLERGQHLVDAFALAWESYHWGDCATEEGLRYSPRPMDWRKQIAALADEPAVTAVLIGESVDAAMRAKSVEDRYFYFFGVVRNKVAAIHEVARRLIDNGDV